MNHLNYSLKFMVMMLLIIIPLTVLSIQQVHTLKTSVSEAKSHGVGVKLLAKSYALTSQLEVWRDVSALHFLVASNETEALHAKAVNEIKSLIDNYETEENFSQDIKSISYLKRIKSFIDNPAISTGNEGTSIQLIYDNAQEYVDEAYEWQRHLANRFSLLSIKDDAIYQGINFILNDSNGLFSEIGKARTYGAYYLRKQFIDSNGIGYLDRIYSNLEQEMEKLDANMPINIALINASGKTTSLDNPLFTVLDLVDQNLIQAIDLVFPWDNYFHEIEKLQAQLKQFNNTLLSVISVNLAAQEDQQRFSLNVFIIIGVTVIALITLLYIGFFYSVKNTINHLIKTSESVALGDLDVQIKTNTNDELSVLASAMDHMRVELRTRHQKLHNLSITDALTQLKNRKFFDEVIESEVNKVSRGCYTASLLLVDIDHFKKINDTHGHPAGDECLRQVSAMLKESFKRTSDVVARYGGEEFAVILPDTDVNGAVNRAENLRTLVESSPVTFAGQTIHMTLSCGVSNLPPKASNSVAEWITAADEALYEAKSTGRNRVKIRTLAEQ